MRMSRELLEVIHGDGQVLVVLILDSDRVLHGKGQRGCVIASPRRDVDGSLALPVAVC